MSAEIRAALLVSALPGMTPALMRQAAGRFASFAAYLAATPGDCPPPLDEPLRHYRRQRASCERGADVAAARLASLAIDLLPLSDTRYPALLREIDRPPPLLYVRGAVDLLSLPQLAIVGSRRASRGALEDARAFAAQLAGGGLVITSGLALGIDGAAHRGALATGRTIAVLGTGVDVVYPRQHAGLAAEILAAGGSLVSEFPPGFPVRRESFPQRNRIISGLAMGVLVVEAAVKSGSLITARLAMEQGREVFAIPGSVHNPQVRGCHQLIREGATLTETLDDVITQLGGMLAYKAEEAGLRRAPPPAPAADEARVLAALGFDPLDPDTLAERTGMAIPGLLAALATLELQGWVDNLGGLYMRVR